MNTFFAIWIPGKIQSNIFATAIYFLKIGKHIPDIKPKLIYSHLISHLGHSNRLRYSERCLGGKHKNFSTPTLENGHSYLFKPLNKYQ